MKKTRFQTAQKRREGTQVYKIHPAAVGIQDLAVLFGEGAGIFALQHPVQRRHHHPVQRAQLAVVQPAPQAEQVQPGKGLSPQGLFQPPANGGHRFGQGRVGHAAGEQDKLFLRVIFHRLLQGADTGHPAGIQPAAVYQNRAAFQLPGGQFLAGIYRAAQGPANGLGVLAGGAIVGFVYNQDLFHSCLPES